MYIFSRLKEYIIMQVAAGANAICLRGEITAAKCVHPLADIFQPLFAACEKFIVYIYRSSPIVEK